MMTFAFATPQPYPHYPQPGYLPQAVDTSWYQNNYSHLPYAIGTIHPTWQNTAHTNASPYASQGFHHQHTIYTDPYRGQALLRQAENEVPLAQIDLQAQRQFLNFQGRNLSEERKYDERSEVRQYQFLDNRQLRQLEFDDKAQEREIKFLNKTQERNFLGTLLTQLVPPVLNTIQNNSNGNREERMFDTLLRFKGLEMKTQQKPRSESDSDKNRELRKRIARLERKLEYYQDKDDKDDKKTKTKKPSSSKSKSRATVVIDRTPSRSW
jgi:hypothetical protein